MSGHRVFIETNRAGTPVFIRRRPSSHKSGNSSSKSSNSSSSGSFFRHRPSMSEVHILREEVARLQYSYDQVAQRSEMQKVEAQRMQRTIAEQNSSIHRLQHELSNFRKESDIAANNAARYQTKYHNMKSKNEDLERQNSDLGAKIRSLTHQLHVDGDRRVLNLREQVDELKRLCASKERASSRMRENLDARIEECATLKSENSTLRRENDILRRSLDAAKRSQVPSIHGVDQASSPLHSRLEKEFYGYGTRKQAKLHRLMHLIITKQQQIYVLYFLSRSVEQRWGPLPYLLALYVMVWRRHCTRLVGLYSSPFCSFFSGFTILKIFLVFFCFSLVEFGGLFCNSDASLYYTETQIDTHTHNSPNSCITQLDTLDNYIDTLFNLQTLDN